MTRHAGEGRAFVPWPWHAVDIVCPHCLGRSGSCCECNGARTIGGERATRAINRGVWARRHRGRGGPLCSCDACKRAGPPRD